MVKTALATSAYLSVAWVLMVSYQVFTETAVKTVVDAIAVGFPAFGGWLQFRIDMIVFIYAFAWVFVLSSLIPSLILGKERGIIVQFIVCLALTLTAFALVDVLADYGFTISEEVLLSNSNLQLFSNVFFAAFYLSLPYILMIALDIRGRRKNKKKQQHTNELPGDFGNKYHTQTAK